MIYVKEEDTRTNDERVCVLKRRRRKDIFIITNRFRTKHNEHRIKRRRRKKTRETFCLLTDKFELPVQQQSIREKETWNNSLRFTCFGVSEIFDLHYLRIISNCCCCRGGGVDWLVGWFIVRKRQNNIDRRT